MTELIKKYTRVYTENTSYEKDVTEEEVSEDVEFIIDSTEIEQSTSGYYPLFKNVTRARGQVVKDQGLAELDEQDSDPENFCEDQLEDIRYDEFTNSNEKN